MYQSDALPSTTVTSATLAELSPAQREAHYTRLYNYLFDDKLKSKRCESAIRNQCEIIADRVAAAPSNAIRLRESGKQMLQTILDGYFSTQPLQDDPLHATGKTRLDILADERASAELPVNRAVSQIYDSMRQFADLAVERAIAQGLSQQRGGQAR
ncbi:MAG: hypothetical protein DI582_08815 [Azospirillum brasilense]|nr:MAG: hypothetical protein DI582_08815 [Azospirillum brasilense]